MRFNDIMENINTMGLLITTIVIIEFFITVIIHLISLHFMRLKINVLRIPTNYSPGFLIFYNVRYQCYRSLLHKLFYVSIGTIDPNKTENTVLTSLQYI